jgi:hypothetical protein
VLLRCSIQHQHPDSIHHSAPSGSPFTPPRCSSTTPTASAAFLSAPCSTLAVPSLCQPAVRRPPHARAAASVRRAVIHQKRAWTLRSILAGSALSSIIIASVICPHHTQNTFSSILTLTSRHATLSSPAPPAQALSDCEPPRPHHPPSLDQPASSSPTPRQPHNTTRPPRPHAARRTPHAFARPRLLQRPCCHRPRRTSSPRRRAPRTSSSTTARRTRDSNPRLGAPREHRCRHHVAKSAIRLP